ncbi:alpha/beta hydrolase family protein [Nocardioides sp. LHG3406-4]|uniref:alpha/beta hydrolase family protein n=1 Tax=Nocardioides sp. LHG3406-4 TaxID=2804575 RepID=UPI003CF40944
MRITRRVLLAAVGATALVAGCGDDVTDPERIAYGDGDAQFGELTRPSGSSRGLVVVIHGGFWKAEYDLGLGRPLAADLAARGWTTWNIEFRRVGAGGGFPATFDDVHAAIEKLADLDVDTSRVVTLGHSAGGHLATWAAARGRFDRWPTAVPVTEVVSQAGVVDLTGAYDADLGSGAVAALMGGPPGPDYDLTDPLRQVPLDAPVWCVHGRADTVVSPEQSVRYVDRARAAGATAEVVEVDGDHFVVIDTDSEAWRRTVEILDGL